MPYLIVSNLSKSFTTPGGREVRALNDVSFSLEQGQILSIVGHNGSGKSTLLACIRREWSFDSGNVTTAGSTVVSVFQDVSVGVVPSMTAYENLALVQSARGNGFLWSIPTRHYRRDIDAFLSDAGLLKRFEAFRHTPVSDLSGGQRQYLASVMAMMREPDVLLLDEFVASLDPAVKDELLSWTRSWIRKKKVTTLMVTHDPTLAESWGDVVLELADGQMVRFSPAQNANCEVER